MNQPPTDDRAAGARDLVSAASRVTVLTGAGISAESGVPTYRGADGLWKDFTYDDVAGPAAFARDPQRVWQWHNERRMALKAVEPNAAHRALAELERALTARGGQFRLVTQNIDGLHQAAGSRSVYELHGTILAIRCSRCTHHRRIDFEEMEAVPSCPSCGWPMRPAIVWFGEMLPTDVWTAALEAATACDVFLSIGTSAAVYPAAGLIEMAVASGAATIEVNLEPTPASTLVDIALHGKAARIVPQLVA
ncbi:MAG: hypothetical protein AMS14_06545 [Planctomycetes bacterium DG_20]|nr:MAG: hypothetical protein AMS14_06545 [Planctomycetes bacterium DG_20]